jgi:hypothetical protein
MCVLASMGEINVIPFSFFITFFMLPEKFRGSILLLLYLNDLDLSKMTSSDHCLKGIYMMLKWYVIQYLFKLLK